METSNISTLWKKGIHIHERDSKNVQVSNFRESSITPNVATIQRGHLVTASVVENSLFYQDQLVQNCHYLCE